MTIGVYYVRGKQLPFISLQNNSLLFMFTVIGHSVIILQSPNCIVDDQEDKWSLVNPESLHQQPQVHHTTKNYYSDY